ncbi:MAG: DUF736 family protein [Candidatus Micrarchaeota archaeon]
MPKKIVEEVEVPDVPEPNGAKAKGPKPDFRVVQTDRGPNGEARFRNIGGMWKKTSKSGNEFYSMSIGNLRLLAFPNEKS